MDELLFICKHLFVNPTLPIHLLNTPSLSHATVGVCAVCANNRESVEVVPMVRGKKVEGQA